MAELCNGKIPKEGKFKAFLLGVLATVLIWAIAEFLPAFVLSDALLTTTQYMVFQCLFLLLGWYFAGFAVRFPRPNPARKSK